MKKLLSAVAIIIAFAGVSPASAASWTSALKSAVASGNYEQIDVIAANNPTAQGEIASFLLNAAQKDSNNPQASVKIFQAAAPFVSQIAPGNAGAANKDILSMLSLANNPNFQQQDPHGAAVIFATVISMSNEPNVSNVNPKLHDVALSQADTFLHDHPDLNDKNLTDEVSLALGNDFLHNNPDIDTRKRPDPPSAE